MDNNQNSHKSMRFHPATIVGVFKGEAWLPEGLPGLFNLVNFVIDGELPSLDPSEFKFSPSIYMMQIQSKFITAAETLKKQFPALDEFSLQIQSNGDQYYQTPFVNLLQNQFGDMLEVSYTPQQKLTPQNSAVEKPLDAMLHAHAPHQFPNGELYVPAHLKSAKQNNTQGFQRNHTSANQTTPNEQTRRNKSKL